MAKCEICLKDALKDGIAVFRINETGVDGIFRCEEHIEDYEVDATVKDIVKSIEEDNDKQS